MRYYLYVSDSKVDMLYEQIPQGWRSKIATELRIDLRLISMSIRQQPNDTTRFGRLSVVENYLRRDQIGSVEHPSAWFEGQMNLRSGVYTPAPGGLVYFNGDGRNGTLLLLIGSARHLIGAGPQPPEISPALSNLPSFLSFLQDELPERMPADRPPNEREVLAEVMIFTEALGLALDQRCSFLARGLVTGDIDTTDGMTRHALLGTPLYVALDDSGQYEPFAM